MSGIDLLLILVLFALALACGVMPLFSGRGLLGRDDKPAFPETDE